MMKSAGQRSLHYVSFATIILLLVLESPTIESKKYPEPQGNHRSPSTRTDTYLSTDPTPRPIRLTKDDPISNRASTRALNNGVDSGSSYTASSTVFLSSARAAANRIFTPERGSTLTSAIQSAKDRFHYAMKYKHLTLPKKKKKFGVPSNLSGGADAESNPPVPTSATQSTATTAAFLGKMHEQRKKILPNIIKANEATVKKVKEGMDVLQKKGAQVTPSVVTFVSVLWNADKGVSFLSLYALALLGASCGFYLFLYFITVGYAAGITLPVAVALRIYKSRVQLSRATLLHSYLTVAWGVRLLAFLIWREYFTWPELHSQVVDLQKTMDIPFASRLLCWLVYSFFYVSMMASNWSRLQSNGRWGLVGYVGLLTQMTGLVLETVADLQKNGFKSMHRHSWCNVGLWKWSTHPNYLGEGLFWWGTYLGHGFNSPVNTVLATIGLVFVVTVLKGSTRSLSRKRLEKYSDQPGYYEFQRTHSIWGPKKWWWWLHGMEELISETSSDFPVGNSTNTTSVKTTAVEEEDPSSSNKKK